MNNKYKLQEYIVLTCHPYTYTDDDLIDKTGLFVLKFVWN